jgi:hypothetical protein
MLPTRQAQEQVCVLCRLHAQAYASVPEAIKTDKPGRYSERSVVWGSQAQGIIVERGRQGVQQPAEPVERQGRAEPLRAPDLLELPLPEHQPVSVKKLVGHIKTQAIGAFILLPHAFLFLNISQ